MDFFIPQDVTFATYFDYFSPLVIFGINLYLSIFYMVSYFRDRSFREYLWFSLLSVGFGGYSLGAFLFLTSVNNPDQAVYINKIQFTFGVLLVMDIYPLVMDIIKKKIQPYMIIILSALSVIFLSLLWFTEYFFGFSGTEFYRVVHNEVFQVVYPDSEAGIVSDLFFAYLFGMHLYAFILMYGYYKKGNRYVLSVLVGILLLFLCAANDVLAISEVPLFKENIYMINFGFLFFNISIATMLSFRYSLLHEEVEVLNKELNSKIEEVHGYATQLEEKIQERTKELDDLNQSLNEQNKKMSWELSVAKNVQTSILPDEFPQHEAVIYGRYLKPMLEVSGDYYNVFEISENLYGILVADVSGHGVPSALITTMVKVAFESFTSQDFINPAEICKSVNLSLFETLSDAGYYLTAFFIILDLDEMTIQYTNAGHQRPLFFRENTPQPERLTTQGMQIGSFDDAQYSYDILNLKVGDKILIFSDGIVRSTDPQGTLFGEERLIDSIQKHRNLVGQDLVDAIIKELNDFTQGTPANDDIVVLSIDIIKEPSFESFSHKKREEVIVELFEEGKASFKKQDFNDAVRSFDKILGYDPDNIGALFYKAKIFSIIKDYESAEDMLRKIIKLQDDDVQALYLMGMVSFYQKKFEPARYYFKRTIKIQPGFRNASSYLDKLDYLLKSLQSS